MPNGLGLGLDLNRRQQQRFTQAAARGTLNDFLADRPRLAARADALQGNQAARMQGYRDQNAQNTSAPGVYSKNAPNATSTPISQERFDASMEAMRARNAPNTAPAGQGGKTSGAGFHDVAAPPGGFQARPTAPVVVTGGPAAPSQQQQQIYNPDGTPAYVYRQGDPVPPPPGTNTAPAGQGGQKNQPAPAGPSYTDALAAQFGEGNPFGQRSWYGGNPLETARAEAEEAVGQQLALLRAQYGAGGLGNSSRLALAQGQAIGDFGRGLGDVLAQRGEAAFQGDAARGLQAILGAGNLQNANNAIALQANQQLAGLGTGLTGIGAQEQSLPNLEAIAALLGAFQTVTGGGNNNSRGASGFAFKR